VTIRCRGEWRRGFTPRAASARWTRRITHENGEYTNEAYGKTPATIRLTVQGGIGQISLVEEP